MKKKQSSKKSRKKILENLVHEVTEKLHKKLRKKILQPLRSRSGLTSSLSLSTNQTQAFLLTTDRSFTFAYWNLDSTKLSKALEHAGPNAHFVLRFYDISQTTRLDQAPLKDIQVYEASGTYYLRLDETHQKLCFDIGLKNKRGDFYSLAQSNTIHTDQPSLPTHSALSLEKSLPFDLTPSTLKRILGPYFFELFEQGKLHTIGKTRLEAFFQDIGPFQTSSRIF